MRSFNIVIGQRGGVPIGNEPLADANNLLADAWLHAWAKAGGGVTIGADGNSLHPWLLATNVEPFRVEEAVAARLINELSDTPGLPLAVRESLSMIASTVEPDRPSTAAWEAAFTAYEAAKRAEDAYDAATWRPAYEADMAAVAAGTSINDEIERLQNIRCDAEDALLATSMTDVSQFARTYLIFFGDKREADFAHPRLEAEARRLTGVNPIGGHKVMESCNG